MRGPDINTQISNLSGPLNTDDNIIIPSNQRMQNFHQPFVERPQQRFLRHTVEIEKTVANGYIMLFVVLLSLLVGIVLIAITVLNRKDFDKVWPCLPVVFLLFIFQII